MEKLYILQKWERKNVNARAYFAKKQALTEKYNFK